MKRTLTIAIMLVAAACGGGKSGGGTTGPGGGGGEGGDPVGGEEGGGPVGGGGEEVVQAEGNPRDDLIPRSVLFGNPEKVAVQLSPDGKHISWVAPSNGVMNVWVAPIDKLDEAKAVTADKVRPVWRYFWTFDNKHLIYIQDKAGDENWHLYRVDAATGETIDLTPVDGARAEVYGLSPSKPDLVAIGLNDRDPKVFDLYHVTLSTGERKLVMQNDQGIAGWHLDRKLALRFAEKVTEDGGTEVLAYQPKNKKSPWKSHEKIASAETMTFGLLGFDKKNASYYAFDARGRDTAAIYKVDAKTKKKKKIYAHDKVDLNGLLLHPTEYTPQAVLVHREKATWVALDKKVEKDLAGIAALGEGSPFIGSRTLDDQTWIVGLDTDAGSPRYFRWDRKAQKGEFLFSIQPALDEQPLLPMHPVVIPARDGLELISYLTLPTSADADGDGKAETPTPMVLLVHGGPWGRDGWGYNPEHQLLANRGYAVLSVNFRGSTGFGKKHVNAGDMQWGKAMHDDLLDAVEWAVKENVAPRDKVCIMGGSYGGYATLVGLTMTPEVFACGVDIVGPSSIVTLFETIPPYWSTWAAVFYARVGDPRTEEGKAALLAVSPLTHADKITKPLLIGQGANDPRVKKSESDQIVKAMQAKKIPVGYVVFPDEGHGFARPENNVAFYAVTEAFLSVHLGGFYQPITEAELQKSSLTIEAGRETLPGLPRNKQASLK